MELVGKRYERTIRDPYGQIAHGVASPHRYVNIEVTEQQLMRPTRVLLDTKDLIDAVEREAPLPRSDLGRELREHNAQIVLTFTNVREFAAPLTHGADILQVRWLLQQIENLPICYIDENSIMKLEITEAVAAFREQREVCVPDPYVQRFDGVVSSIGPMPTRVLVNQRLDDLVFLLWRAKPNLLRPFSSLSSVFRGGIQTNRKIPAARLAVTQPRLAALIRQQAEHWKVSLASDDSDRFFKWVFENPARCPTARYQCELYLAMVRNSTNMVKGNDLADLAQTWTIPYVDLITVDRRISGYCAQVNRRLEKVNPTLGYTRRFVSSVSDVLLRLKSHHETEHRFT